MFFIIYYMERPGVGLSVIVMRDNQVLLGRRKGSHGAGTWAFPGGHLEFYEEFKDCALRELREETGEDMKVQLIDKNPCAITNDFFKDENKHYVTLYMRAKYVSGGPKVMEPKKCEGWEWISWNNLPLDVFIPFRNLMFQGYNPFKK